MQTAIALNVYEESVVQVRTCLGKIAEFMPDSEVLVILNKQRDDLFSCLTDARVCSVSGPNYACNAYWNLWWLRMLSWFERVDPDVAIKLDPDTMIDMTPKKIPTSDYFGDVHKSAVTVAPDVYWHKDPVEFIQGGIVGLSRQARIKLKDSDILASQHLSRWCPAIAPEMIFMEDHLFSQAMKTVGIRPERWTECKSQWRIPIPNNPPEFAIVHPRYY